MLSNRHRQKPEPSLALPLTLKESTQTRKETGSSIGSTWHRRTCPTERSSRVRWSLQNSGSSCSARASLCVPVWKSSLTSAVPRLVCSLVTHSQLSYVMSQMRPDVGDCHLLLSLHRVFWQHSWLASSPSMRGSSNLLTPIGSGSPFPSLATPSHSRPHPMYHGLHPIITR